MVREFKKGDEIRLFHPIVVDLIYQKISEDICKYLKSQKEIKKVIIGAMALHDVPLSDGTTTKLWLEYNGNFLPGGMDCGIYNIILYDDEIPDELLDRYNLISKSLSL